MFFTNALNRIFDKGGEPRKSGYLDTLISYCSVIWTR
jgi:hypothetical protein